MGSVPERLTWAVENLDLAPGDRVPEVAAGGFATEVRQAATGAGNRPVCVRAIAPTSAGEGHAGHVGGLGDP